MLLYQHNILTYVNNKGGKPKMARTKMKIVGLGNRMQGVSKKNGKPYDFQPISFVYQYTNGYKAATSNVPGDMIDAIGGVKVDEEREIFFHGYNGTVTVDGIL